MLDKHENKWYIKDEINRNSNGRHLVWGVSSLKATTSRNSKN
nr:MAG TPA: hypothetical protein [Caudoviricetes sp.]